MKQFAHRRIIQADVVKKMEDDVKLWKDTMDIEEDSGSKWLEKHSETEKFTNLKPSCRYYKTDKGEIHILFFWG